MSVHEVINRNLDHTYTAARIITGNCPNLQCGRALVLFNNYGVWGLFSCPCGWQGATTEVLDYHRTEVLDVVKRQELQIARARTANAVAAGELTARRLREAEQAEADTQRAEQEAIDWTEQRRLSGESGQSPVAVVFAVGAIALLALILVWIFAAHAGATPATTITTPTTTTTVYVPVAPAPATTGASEATPAPAPTVQPDAPHVVVAATPAPDEVIAPPATGNLTCEAYTDGSPGQGGDGVARWSTSSTPAPVVAANPTMFRNCTPTPAA